MYHVDVKELKKAMIDAGIDTIQDLSDKSGINRNTLSDILKEKIYPSSDVMVRLANTLSLPTEKCGWMSSLPVRSPVHQTAASGTFCPMT